MKPSTKKAIDETMDTMRRAGLPITEAGFKYHSERTWLGLTTKGDVVWLEIPKEGDFSVVLYRRDYKESIAVVGGVVVTVDKSMVDAVAKPKKGKKPNGG